ncbi:MAG TPA: BON domain-containing protein, partial [Candidatus Angelobacter sp.]
MKKCATLATLLALTMSVAVTRAASQIPAQNIQTAGLSLQAEKPPHVDAEPSPADRDLERTIKDALGQDPHMAYSRVNVHVDDKAVVLGGVVLT